MAIKVTSKGEANLETAKEQHKRLGKRSKAKGGNYERDVAKKFKEQYDEELTRTPQSGGFAKKSQKADEFRGDIVALDENVDLMLHIECKAHKVLSLPAWLSQSESDCPKGKIPVVIYHKHGTSKNYIVLDYLSFFGISAPPVSTICVQKPDIEEWKSIEGFPDYSISSLGRVCSTNSHNGKTDKGEPLILQEGIDSGGYSVVVLRKDNMPFTKRVHKLVTKEFLGVCSLVNHRDGNKQHNWVSNLEGSNYSLNLQHAYDTGLRPKGEDIKASKLTDIEVATIRLRLNWGDNQKELADEYKVSVTTISRVAKEDYRNPLNLSFNFHYQKTWSLPAWFEQAESDAPKGKAPCVIFHKHGTSKDYIALSLEDFFKLVPKDRVIHKKVNM